MDDATGRTDGQHADVRPSSLRREWPEWLTPANVSFILTALGGISYVALYEFSYSFLSKLGTSPEEVGVNQAALIVRAAIFGGYVIGLAFVYAVVFQLFGLFLMGRLASRLARARFRGAVRGYGADNPRESRTRLIAASCAAVPASFLFIGGVDALGGWNLVNAITALVIVGIFFAIVYSLFRAIARRHHAAAILAFVLVVLGYSVVLARSFGTEAAEDVLRDGRTDFPIERVAGLEARLVCIAWVSGSGPFGVPDEGVYLGHANGVSLIVDEGRLLRVRDAQVQAFSAPVTGAKTDPCD